LYKELDSFKWYSPKYEEMYRRREDTELNPEAKKYIFRVSDQRYVIFNK